MGALLVFLALLATQMVAPSAMAQIAADACPADVAGSSVQCVSQDVSLAFVDYEPGNLPTECVAGAEISLDVRLGFVVNANARRYDIATWIAKEAGDIKQPSASGGPSSCSLLVARDQYFSEIPDPPLPAVPNPVDGILIVDNLDGDICYDTLPAARQYFAADFPNGLTVTCQPGPDGTLTFQTLVSWSTQSRNNCDGTPASFVSEVSNSKCAAGDPINLPIDVLSRLVIEKRTNPAGVPDVFNFSGTIDGAPITGFPLSDGQTQELSGALDATYVIAEAAVNGFEIDSIVCTNETTGEPAVATIDEANGTVTVAMTNSQFDVRCVYTNNAPAQVTIVKSAGVGDDTFTFDTNLAAPDDVIQLTTSGGGANSGPIIIPVPDSSTPVPVRILERALAGWNLADITCSGTDENVVGNEVDFTVQPGDDVACTFTNVKQGTLTIIKDTVGGDGTFQFNSTSLPGGDFTITTANNTGFVNFGSIAPGGYTVAEVVPAGWDFTEATCVEIGGTDNSGTISGTEIGIIIESGETVTCTFTNTQRGVIEIAKVTDPNPPTGVSPDFRFTSSYVPEFFVANGQTNVSATLVPGTYTVTEDDPSALGASGLGFDLTNLTCVDTPPPGGSAGIDSSGDTTTRTATINLDPGETVRCTFTNTQRGALIVTKEVTADGPAIDTFEFTSNTLSPSSFTLGPVSFGSPDTAEFPRLEPGTYDVAETVPGGWSLVNTTCSDGSTVNNIGVDPGEVVICTFTNAPLGSATIVKNTFGGDNTFAFTGDAPFDGLSLDTSTIGGTASQDFTNQLDPALNPYTITEEPIPGGWALTNLGCQDPTGDSTVDLGLATATINAQFAEEVTCTFTNTLDGTITIRKETLPDGATDLFTFEGDVAGSIADGEWVTVDLQPGIYTSNELVPSGWEVTDISCQASAGSSVVIGAAGGFDAGDTGVEITLAAGGNVDCTFTNTKQGKITIGKSVIGTGGTFNFGSATLNNFSLTPPDDGTDQRTFPNLLPDTYIVAENVPAGYKLTNIVCLTASGSTVTIGAAGSFDPGDSGVSIDLAPGDDVTCTFTNTQLGSITVEKQTLPDGSTQSFAFTGDAAGSITDGGTIVVSNLLPGAYTSTETVPAGWVLTSISCLDDDSTGDLNTATVTFNIAPGENIVCTFTNTQDGTVIIRKETLPDGSPEVFQFVGDITGAISDGGDITVSLPPGTYTTDEVVPDGWQLTEIACSADPGSSATESATGVSIDLAAGEVVDCRFTNTQDGTVIIRKETLPDGSPEVFQFVGDITGAISDGGDITVSLPPGTYTTDEVVPDGWQLTEIACSVDPDSSATESATGVSIDLAAGEVVDCRFTNTQDGTITLIKNLPNDNGGDATAADFQAYIDGNTVAWGTPLAYKPGTYVASEDTLTGYTPSDWSGDCSAAGVIDLGPGENLTCQITNDDVAPKLTLIKEVTNDNGGDAQPDDFNLTVGGSAVLSGATNEYDANVALAINETQLAGYNFVSLTGDAKCPGGLGGTITLDEGDDITCTITNDDEAPGLTLVKAVVNDNGGDLGPDDFGLTVGGNPVTSGSTRPVDANTPVAINEATVDGYDFVSITGDAKCPAALGGTVTLDPGENVSCTITNDDVAPKLTLTKVVENNYFGTAGPDDFGISVGGNVVTSGATLEYDANVALAIDETQVDGYEFVSITGDAACPQALGGTVTLNPGDDIACTITNRDIAPDVNLAKAVSGSATLENDGTYTVVYTITATNNSQGIGRYNIVDTFSPSAGISFNSATLQYQAGTENDQSGTISGTLNSGGQWVTDEELGIGLSESWIVTANFTVDPATLDPATAQCDPGAPVINTGFYNAVSGVDQESNTDDNATCTGVPVAGLNLAKSVDGSATLENDGTYTVVYTVTATNTGEGPGNYDVVDTFSPANGITLNSAAIAYGAGETQSGTVTSPFTSGATAVTGEALAAGASETWTVTANFSVDPSVLVPAEGQCDPANPVANTGFYNAVSGVDSESDTSDNDACTGVPTPSINLAKTVNGPATLENDGSYTVVYTVSATNSGGGPGTYNVVDTFSPPSGVTLNTAAIAYGGGETQTGTVTSPFASGATAVSGEALVGGGASETWIVTANFSVDEAVLDPAAAACDPANPVINTGFYNAVSGVDAEAGTDDNDTCTGIPRTPPMAAPPIAVPVNNSWALLLMLLSILSVAWYFRPGHGRGV